MLRLALESVLGQRGVRVQAIVVDDGSAQPLDDLLARYAGAGVTLLRHERSLGVARTRNDGIAAATAPWIGFLDDDDAWGPEKLRRQLDAAGDAGTAWCYTAAVNVDGGYRAIDFSPAPPADGLLAALLADNEVPGGCSSVVARTELVRGVGGFDERLAVLADWDLWIRLAAEGPAAAVADDLVAYVEHGANMHAAAAQRQLDELAVIEAKHAALRARHGVDFAVTTRRWRAFTHHRAGRRARSLAAFAGIAARGRSRGDLRNLLDAAAGHRRTEARRHVWTRMSGRSEPAWLPALRARAAAPD
jgi:glycosyltransferase involved in cell wall biosynthesis